MPTINSFRLGGIEQALDYPLHPLFQFYDAGYPASGSRIATPAPGRSLLAMALLSDGSGGVADSRFPEAWQPQVETFVSRLAIRQWAWNGYKASP